MESNDETYLEFWIANRRGHWDDPTLRETGDCACGNSDQMRQGYHYNGEANGHLTCFACGRVYIVDLNGIMWEDIEAWVNA